MRSKNIIASGLLLIFISVAQAATYTEGQDYILVPDTVRHKKNVQELIDTDPGKVQLLFFFSFGCPACAQFDPMFEKWLNAHHNPHIVTYRFPVSFEENWHELAKLYYVMQDLQPSKNLNADIFNAIHKQKMDLWQETAMQQFFKKYGYPPQKVADLFDSYEVNLQAKHADDISIAYGIKETPTIVINGPQHSYLVNPDQAGGDDNKLLDTVSYLVNK